jgi:hypothetical protein
MQVESSTVLLPTRRDGAPGRRRHRQRRAVLDHARSTRSWFARRLSRRPIDRSFVGKHCDPATGKKTGFVLSCFDQDQPMDAADFTHLAARLRQTTAQEKLTSLWLDQLFELQQVPRVWAGPAPQPGRLRCREGKPLY